VGFVASLGDLGKATNQTRYSPFCTQISLRGVVQLGYSNLWFMNLLNSQIGPSRCAKSTRRFWLMDPSNLPIVLDSFIANGLVVAVLILDCTYKSTRLHTNNKTPTGSMEPKLYSNMLLVESFGNTPPIPWNKSRHPTPTQAAALCKKVDTNQANARETARERKVNTRVGIVYLSYASVGEHVTNGIRKINPKKASRDGS